MTAHPSVVPQDPRPYVPTPDASRESGVQQTLFQVDNLAAALSCIATDVANIQAIIAELQAELASLAPPSPRDFMHVEYDSSSPPKRVEVLDQGAFNAAMTTYLGRLQSLQSALGAKQTELANKETELANKHDELERAKERLKEAHEAARRAGGAGDDRVLGEQMKRIEQLEQDALRLEAQLQMAQGELEAARNSLARSVDAALMLGGYGANDASKILDAAARWCPEAGTPPAFQCSADVGDADLAQYWRDTLSSTQDTKDALNRAANDLPALRNGVLLPPVNEVSARDYIDLAPSLATYERSSSPINDGLLADYDPSSGVAPGPELREQMVTVWLQAGFSQLVIDAMLTNAGDWDGPARQAAADYADIRDGGSDDATRAFLDKLHEHADDPTYQAALIREAKLDTTGLDLLSSDHAMAPSGQSAVFGRGIDGSYTDMYSNADRAVLASAIKAAHSAGVYSTQELQTLAGPASTRPGDPSAAWREVGAQIGVSGVAVPSVVAAEGVSSAAQEVNAARAAYDQAAGEWSQATADLSRDLAQLGPGLSEQHRNAYIEAYWNEHQSLLDEVDRTARDLEAALAKNGHTLEAAAAASPPREDAKAALYAGYRSLATSPLPKSAMDFVVRVCQNPALSAAFADKDIIKDIFEQAAGTFAGQVVSNPALDLDQAREELRGVFHQYAGALNLTDLQSGLGDVGKDLQSSMNTLDDVLCESPDPTDPESVKKYLNRLTDATFNGKAGNTVALIGVILASMTLSTQLDGKDPRDYAGATASLAEVLSRCGDVVLMAGTFISRYPARHRAPGESLITLGAHQISQKAGLVAGAASLLIDTWALVMNPDPGAGDVVNVVGDVLSVAGAICLCCGAEPLGIALLCGGAIVSTGGQVYDDATNDERAEEKARLLTAAGVDEQAARALAYAKPKDLQALAQMGLTPEQLQSLAQMFPSPTSFVSQVRGFTSSLEHICNAGGLTPSEVYDQIKAVADRDPTGKQVAHLLVRLAINDTEVVADLRALREQGRSHEDIKQILVDRFSEMSEGPAEK